MPGFHQIIIEPNFIDRINRGLRICIRGEQHALGLWIRLNSFFKEFYAVHLRHTVVNQKQCNGFIPLLQFFQVIEGCSAGVDWQDAIFLTVMRAQVAFNRIQNGGIIVNGENDWLWHLLFFYFHNGSIWRISNYLFFFHRQLFWLRKFCSSAEPERSDRIKSNEYFIDQDWSEYTHDEPCQDG